MAGTPCGKCKNGTRVLLEKERRGFRGYATQDGWRTPHFPPQLTSSGGRLDEQFSPPSEKKRSGQIRSGQVRSGQVRSTPP